MLPIVMMATLYSQRLETGKGVTGDFYPQYPMRYTS